MRALQRPRHWLRRSRYGRARQGCANDSIFTAQALAAMRWGLGTGLGTRCRYRSAAFVGGWMRLDTVPATCYEHELGTLRTQRARSRYPCQLVSCTVCPAKHVQEGGLAINGTPSGIIASSESSRDANNRRAAAVEVAGPGCSLHVHESTQYVSLRLQVYLYSKLDR